MSRETVKGILIRLADSGYLTVHTYKSIRHYWIESPEVLQDKIRTKLRIAENLGSYLRDLYRAESHLPYAAVYDTKTSIKKFLDTVIAGSSSTKGSVIYTIESPHRDNYRKIMSSEMVDYLLDRKKEKKIVTHTLIPYGMFHLIRKPSLWFLGDRMVMFSGEYPFVVEVRHPTIVGSVRSIVMFLWGASEEKYRTI